MQDVIGLVSALIGLATAVIGWVQLSRQRAQATATPGGWSSTHPQQPHAPAGGPAEVATFSWEQMVGGAPHTAPVPAFPGSKVSRARASEKAEIWAAVRDAGFIFAASIVLGFFVAVADPQVGIGTVGVLNIACLLVGFTIVAVRVPGDRWRHLLWVGLVTWALSLINVLVGVVEVGSWFLAAVLIAVCAAAAGGVAGLIRKKS